MTVAEAQAIWSRLMVRDEGWVDAMARLEKEGRTLTDEEQEAADVLWIDLAEAMKNLAQAANPQ